MDTEVSTILHLDMDAFFASIEVRDAPHLHGLPVVVGGEGNRSVVAAASYPARSRGIHAAMPMASARRLARDLVIVPPRIRHYGAVSRQVMEILGAVSPEVEQVSVDEAFLDVRGAQRLFGSPEDIGNLLRRRIREELDLPSSVGISVSRAVAKIASAQAKPDGLLVVPPDRTAAFLAPLSVSVLSGVGPKAAAALERLGVHSIGQLREIPPATLRRAVGPQGAMLTRIAAGEDRTGLGREVRDRSIGTERTVEVDMTDPARIRRWLTGMADEVGRSLRRERLLTRTVSIKLRAPDGTTITRSSTMSQPTAVGERLREHVIALWEREAATMPRLRLAGVRAEHLQAEGTGGQDELTGRTTGWRDLEAVMDRALDRFGSSSLTRGSSLDPGDPDAEGGARGAKDPSGTEGPRVR